MPYEIIFTKAVTISDPEIYINQCCWGGDVVRDQLLPSLLAKFEDFRTEQEDWGWFIWFKRGAIRLAVDIFCDDPETGKFRIHLTARRKKLLLIDEVDNTPELEEVRQIVFSNLEGWDSKPSVASV
jgi:hypothetical protein